MGDIAQRGNRLTFAKGGIAGKALRGNKLIRGKDSKTHGKDVPTMAAEGGRIGLKKGGKPWGTGPKPGSHEFLMQNLHKRKGKAIGGVIKKVIQAGKKGVKKISDAARKQDLADSMKRFEHAGPHEGEVITKRILGKGTKKGDRTKAAVKDAMEAKPWVGKPHAKGGRIGKAVGGGFTRRKWMNPLEQMGGSPKGKPHSTKEGRIASGTRRLQRMRQKALNDYHDITWAGKDPEKGKPHSSQEGRIATGRRNFKRFLQKRVGAKKGGKADKNWIQKAVDPKHKGYCTPMTKKTCTPARKALARTFKKKAKTGWG